MVATADLCRRDVCRVALLASILALCSCSSDNTTPRADVQIDDMAVPDSAAPDAMVRDGAAADGPRSDAGLADSVALDASPADGTVADGAVTFVLQAKAFVDGGKIPATPFTCKGSSYPAGSSPALSWSGAPIGTQSFALIMDDLTASNWTHWVYYRIPASASALPAGDNTSGTLGKEQQGQTRYAGPCPPSGVHTYRFRLFALSGTLSKLAAGATRAQLETAMAQQILAVATLTGTVAKADL